MKTPTLFSDFNGKVRLVPSKRDKLQTNRDALRKRIHDHFEKKKWDQPKFYPQGSVPLATNLNPIKTTNHDGDTIEEYDLDDGVYFICAEDERKEPATYHDRIKRAVEGHKEEVVGKDTCVRVVYADGHHVDLPPYWSEQDDDTPQLAHKSKGFTDSDPRKFKDWVDTKISQTSEAGQLRRDIRFLKAWKDHRENTNKNLKLPSGFILTILACNNYQEDNDDGTSFSDTVKAIKSDLDASFCCYRPTTPTNEDLLTDYDKGTAIAELENVISHADAAEASDCEKEASEHWRKVFGDRFPLGKKKETSQKKPPTTPTRKAQADNPWLRA
jgi:hypothetical protein